MYSLRFNASLAAEAWRRAIAETDRQDRQIAGCFSFGQSTAAPVEPATPGSEPGQAAGNGDIPGWSAASELHVQQSPAHRAA
jgi:hypothetical protein